MDTTVRRGDIYYADLSPVVGSEQGGVRPVLIVQNDTGNQSHRHRRRHHVAAGEGKAAYPYRAGGPGQRTAAGFRHPAGADTDAG